LTTEAARDEAVRRGAEALRQASAALKAGRANAIAVVERDAASLAVELTRTLVDHELSVSDDEISATVRRALRLTAPGEDLVVRLHPDEVVGAEVLQPLVTDCKITVVGDADVEPGGCVIDAGPCRIDAQIEPALARVKLALLSGRTPDTAMAPRPVDSALDQAWGGW
jgi:flagellar assembly protein FliH